jgi:hypothetical protein
VYIHKPEHFQHTDANNTQSTQTWTNTYSPTRTRRKSQSVPAAPQYACTNHTLATPTHTHKDTHTNTTTNKKNPSNEQLHGRPRHRSSDLSRDTLVDENNDFFFFLNTFFFCTKDWLFSVGFVHSSE